MDNYSHIMAQKARRITMWPNGVLKWPNMVLKCTVPMGAIYFYFLWVSRPIGSLSGLFYHKNSPFLSLFLWPEELTRIRDIDYG